MVVKEKRVDFLFKQMKKEKNALNFLTSTFFLFWTLQNVPFFDPRGKTYSLRVRK